MKNLVAKSNSREVHGHNCNFFRNFCIFNDNYDLFTILSIPTKNHSDKIYKNTLKFHTRTVVMKNLLSESNSKSVPGQNCNFIENSLFQVIFMIFLQLSLLQRKTKFIKNI